MRLMQGLVIAFTTYSRIPMPQMDWKEENRRYALYFLPLVGAVVGGVVWVWFWICGQLGCSPLLRGTVAAVLPIWVTGGIHMDGFLDTSDALASWQAPEKRLEILKDSRVGAGAVMACGGYLLLSAGVMEEAFAWEASSLAWCFVASRAACAWTSVAFRSARPGGMLDGFAHGASKKVMGLVCGLVLAVCAVVWILWMGWRAGLPLLALAACVLFYRRMAYRSFGGVTGDLAGWLVQVSELCMMAAIVIGGKL